VERRSEMKRIVQVLLLTIMAIALSGSALAGRAPHQIAGITVGDDVAMHVHLVNMESALPSEDMRYITEVWIKPLDGYKSGSVAFGNCAAPGKILQIKLKYAYSGRKFYDKLLNIFEDRFGEPHVWKGDPFGAIVTWKWSFKDKNNNSISLILQHSTDPDYKFGNSVKLTNRTAIERERTCYEKKFPEEAARQRQRGAREKIPKDFDFEPFIPR
jgi:hypothetical protein